MKTMPTNPDKQRWPTREGMNDAVVQASIFRRCMRGAQLVRTAERAQLVVGIQSIGARIGHRVGVQQLIRDPGRWLVRLDAEYFGRANCGSGRRKLWLPFTSTAGGTLASHIPGGDEALARPGAKLQVDLLVPSGNQGLELGHRGLVEAELVLDE